MCVDCGEWPMHRYLKAWRDYRGLSQERVGNILGVRHTTVGRWEKGKMRLTTENLEALAKIYGASVSQLQAPPEAAGLVARLDQAQRILEGMSDEDVAQWLILGERLKRTT